MSSWITVLENGKMWKMGFSSNIPTSNFAFFFKKLNCATNSHVMNTKITTNFRMEYAPDSQTHKSKEVDSITI